MRSDVHFAALKAAAKVAFSVALLNGCSSADLLGEGADETDGDEATSSESAYSNGARSTKKGLGKKPCPSKDAGPAKPTCEQVLTSTFPTPGDYQWEGVPQSKDVVACCDAELTKNGAGSAYRWDCCVAYDPTVDAGSANWNPGLGGAGGHGMACTPWGPPVPPSMTRIARRRNAAMTAWIAKAQADALKAVA